MPNRVDVELTQDLVGSAVPGDIVTITGTVKALSTESITGKGSRKRGGGPSRESGLLVLLIEANAVQNDSRDRATTTTNDESTTNDNDVQTETSDVVASLTQQDIDQIRQVALTTNCFYDLVHSLCPMIFGHELVKAGLLLVLLGGHSDDSNSRPDMHTLLIGEPGIGKSQLLKACSKVAPKAVYVSGNTTSTSGLTVTIAKDSNGEFALEAGALVLADRGVCCIDEFDKLTAQHAALLEAMEQQSISIAKAGIVCTLNSRTSIIAAANAKGGTYKRNKTLQENIKLSPALLSRFDLIYVLLDNPDATDELIVEHVMRMHTSDGNGGFLGNSTITNQSRHQTPLPITATSSTQEEDREPLRNRLKAMGNEGQPLLTPVALRKYIAYAKEYCKPKLSRQACAVLQRFYLQQRKRTRDDANSTPITNRQLESYMRLATARAKSELRELVSEQDARDVISLVQDTQLDLNTTNDETFLSPSGTTGQALSMNSQRKKLIHHLHSVANNKRNAFFTMTELKREGTRIGIQANDHEFMNLIYTLNDQCFFLKKPGGYLLQQNAYTSSFSST